MPVERTRGSRRTGADGKTQLVWTQPAVAPTGGIAFATNLTPEEFAPPAPPQAKTEDADADADAPPSFFFFDPPAGAGAGPAPPKRASHKRKPSPPVPASPASPNNNDSGIPATGAGPSPHIPRPPNAFILFRSAFIRSGAVPPSSEPSHATLSAIAGLAWGALPPDVRGGWHERARKAREEHGRRFPGYAFRPKRGGGAASSSSVAEKPGGAADNPGRGGGGGGARASPSPSEPLDAAPASCEPAFTPKRPRTTRETLPPDPARCAHIASLLLAGRAGSALEADVRAFDAARAAVAREVGGGGGVELRWDCGEGKSHGKGRKSRRVERGGKERKEKEGKKKEEEGKETKTRGTAKAKSGARRRVRSAPTPPSASSPASPTTAAAAESPSPSPSPSTSMCNSPTPTAPAFDSFDFDPAASASAFDFDFNFAALDSLAPSPSPAPASPSPVDAPTEGMRACAFDWAFELDSPPASPFAYSAPPFELTSAFDSAPSSPYPASASTPSSPYPAFDEAPASPALSFASSSSVSSHTSASSSFPPTPLAFLASPLSSSSSSSSSAWASLEDLGLGLCAEAGPPLSACPSLESLHGFEGFGDGFEVYAPGPFDGCAMQVHGGMQGPPYDLGLGVDLGLGLVSFTGIEDVDAGYLAGAAYADGEGVSASVW